MDASARTATTGVSTQRALPVTERRTWTSIHTASATSSGGHTQFREVRVSLPGVKISRAVPVAPMATAGTAAHRCGCRVRRTVSVAISAQPNPNASSRAPVMVASVAPANTTRVSTRAVTAPVTTEATMVRPAGRPFVASAADVGVRSCRLVRCVWMLMMVSLSGWAGRCCSAWTRTGCAHPGQMAGIAGAGCRAGRHVVGGLVVGGLVVGGLVDEGVG